MARSSDLVNQKKDGEMVAYNKGVDDGLLVLGLNQGGLATRGSRLHSWMVLL